MDGPDGGPKSLALAGRVADGVVLAEGAGPSYVRWAVAQAGDPAPFRVTVFSALCITTDAREARRIMAPFVGRLLASPTPNVRAHPQFDALRERWRQAGDAGIAEMPSAWWHELGAIGTFDEAVAHVAALHDAGADDVALFPAADLDVARRQVDDVARLAAALR